MPAVRTTPRDVLIRVPKVEPYSNSYLPPSARAREEAKKLTAAATTGSSTASADATTTTAIADATAAATTAASAIASTSTVAPSQTAATDAFTAAPTSRTTATSAGTSLDAAQPDDGGGEDVQDRRQRGNSPTLPFLDVHRQEDHTVELSKAATSSAGWNSLLVWARRQRGAQWDASTALWQVDRYSREYYSFCEDPATTDRAKQPGDATQDGSDKKPPAVQGEEDDDKGPIRVSSRNREDATDASNASPPPVALGRSIRLLRR